MQLGPQSVGMAPPKPSIVRGAAYVYDVAHRNGLVTSTLKGQDIAGVSVAALNMCPGGMAAAVTSVTGGAVQGFDMYGQIITEVVGAAGTSKYTFSHVIDAPADALWANVFGLPYKWASGGTVNTYTPPAADGDPRGTVAPATAGNDIVLDYTADTAMLYGEPLADRFGSAGTDVPDPNPQPMPPLPPSFASHGEAEAWLDAYTAWLGIGTPFNWDGKTLEEKHVIATELVAAHQ